MSDTKIKKREYDQKWRLKNIDRIKDINKEWRKKNKERIAENRKRYKINNIFTVRISEIKHRCNKKSIECNIDEEYLQELLLKQNNKCFYSGIEFIPLDKHYGFSVDRINPNKGYIKGNINILCNVVNTMKNNLREEEFINIIKTIYVKFCKTRIKTE